MDVKVTGTKFELFLDGPISEKTPLYDYNIKGASEVILNLKKVTFINSIGVKNWITWTVRVPENSSLVLEDCPFVIVSQAGIVKGFLPDKARIFSFYAPFVCPDCGAETVEKLNMGQNYKYAEPGQKAEFSFPVITCPKCKAEMEPDFIPAKTFTFLDPK